MRVKRLIKSFVFNETERKTITLGAGIRLNPDTDGRTKQRLELIGPPFPTAGTAKTRVWNPSTVKQWLGFQAIISNVKIDNTQVTDAGFRLGDGTNEFFWNGSAWVIDVINFNTEADVAANIGTFPVATQSLQVIVNLTTTNPKVTPQLEEVKILWASDIEFHEDILYRSFVRSLRDKIRPITDYVVVLAAASSTIDLKIDFPLKTPYNIISIDAVYNRTTDPKRLTDLFSSFNPTTEVITLTTPIGAGEQAFIRIIYEPEIAVTTSTTYSEIQKLPIIVLTDVDLVDASESGIDDSIVNKGAGTAVKLPSPIEGDLQITLRVITDKALDQIRLTDEVKRYFLNNPLLRSTGLDEDFSLWLIDEYDMKNPTDRGDVHSGQATVRVRDVKFYVRDAVDIFSVRRFKLTGTEDFTLATE